MSELGQNEKTKKIKLFKSFAMDVANLRLTGKNCHIIQEFPENMSHTDFFTRYLDPHKKTILPG